MSSSWKAGIGVLLVFLLGWTAGVLCHIIYAHHQVIQIIRNGTVPEAVAQMMERRMTYNLDLNSDQQQQIHGFIIQNLQQRRVLQVQIQPQVQQANRETLRQILSVLTPDQQTKLRDNIAEFRQRFGKNPFSTSPSAGEAPPPANPPPISSPAPATTNAP
jgi:hypothetical protein